jgi:hypothetical protein
MDLGNVERAKDSKTAKRTERAEGAEKQFKVQSLKFKVQSSNKEEKEKCLPLRAQRKGRKEEKEEESFVFLCDLCVLCGWKRKEETALDRELHEKGRSNPGGRGEKKMTRKLLIAATLASIVTLNIGCAGMSDLVRAEGESKNASYIAENRFVGIRVGFEQPSEGNIPLPSIRVGRADSVFGIMAPGKDEGLRYRNRRNIRLDAGGEGLPDAGAVSGDETIIAIDEYKYLGEIPAAPVAAEESR